MKAWGIDYHIYTASGDFFSCPTLTLETNLQNRSRNFKAVYLSYSFIFIFACTFVLNSFYVCFLNSEGSTWEACELGIKLVVLKSQEMYNM